MPSNPADAKGLLKSAIRDDNPVLYFEDKMMYNEKGPIPEGDYTVPLGEARIHREGTDATLICTSSMLYPAIDAANQLAEEGIEVEVIDPRSITPLDEETLVNSAIKTGHVLIIDEGYQNYGVTAEIAARVQEKAFDYLDAPVRRLGAADVPIPFAPSLEDLTIPSADRIVEIVHEMRA
jgi:pyruvate dehydrogenase E1 component beta subunit